MVCFEFISLFEKKARKIPAGKNSRGKDLEGKRPPRSNLDICSTNDYIKYLFEITASVRVLRYKSIGTSLGPLLTVKDFVAKKWKHLSRKSSKKLKPEVTQSEFK